MILQPQGGIDVTGGGRGAHDAPVGAVQVFPSQLFAVINLSEQLLTLIGGAGDHESTIGNSLLFGSFGGLAIVPILGVIGILAEAVTGGSEDDLGAVIVQNIGAAGDEANIDGTGFQTFADCLVGGADGDLNFADLVAFFGQLFLEHCLQGLGDGDDLGGLTGRNESDLEGFDLLGIRVIAGGGVVAAADHHAEDHDDYQQKRKQLFHLFFLHNDSSLSFLPAVCGQLAVQQTGQPATLSKV